VNFFWSAAPINTTRLDPRLKEKFGSLEDVEPGGQIGFARLASSFLAFSVVSQYGD
jgi:hypothetical protein